MYEIVRSTDTPAELIERSNGFRSISGYAVLWYDGTSKTEYDLGQIVERCRRGDFEPIVRSQKEPIALRLNHSKDCELDNTQNTLTLSCDNVGLHFDAPYDAQDPDHQKVLAKFRKKQIRGCSFGAMARHSFQFENGKTVGYVQIVRMTDVSLIGGNTADKPAYKNTTCIIRTEQDEYEDWRKAQEETEKRFQLVELLRSGLEHNSTLAKSQPDWASVDKTKLPRMAFAVCADCSHDGCAYRR